MKKTTDSTTTVAHAKQSSTLSTAWKKGQSGNPQGKPVGTLNKKTLLAMALLEKDLEAITTVVITAAKGGDMQAARFIVERMVPPMRERPITIDLPTANSSAGVCAAQQAILDAVSRGELLPAEGNTLAGIVEMRRKSIETEELELRIAALEKQK